MFYLLWANTFKYVFPREVLEPFNEAMSGVMTKLSAKLKLYKKPKTVNEEENKQNHTNEINAKIEVEDNFGIGKKKVDLNHEEIEIRVDQN